MSATSEPEPVDPDVALLNRAADRLDGLPGETDRALAAVFRRWAWMGRFDPDQLHRTGGPETITLAQLIAIKETP